MRTPSIAICGWILLGCAGAAWAADAGDLVFSQVTAERHGLTRAWYTQVAASGTRSHVTHVVLDDDLLLVQASDAMLYALNAETGRLVWSTEVGSPTLPTLRPGANGRMPSQPVAAKKEVKDNAPKGAADENAAPAADTKKKAAPAPVSIEPPAPPVDRQIVAVVNGSSLYLLDRRDGRPHMDVKHQQGWKIRLKSGAPVAGPLVTDDKVFVPTAAAQLEVYSIDNIAEAQGVLESSGAIEAPPCSSGSRIAWGTNRGSVHITSLEASSVKNRVQVGGPVVAPLVARSPRIFAGSLDTLLYCVHDTSGAILWQFSAGSPIRHRPMLIEDSVYVLPEDGGIACLTVLDGKLQWSNPAGHQFLAVSPTRVYEIDQFHRLQVLDAKTGATVDTIALPESVKGVANSFTDRIYLSSAEGVLQGLHETELHKAVNHLAPKEIPPAEAPIVPKEKGAESAPASGPPTP
jgi:outer membrane protein assembly factor BamB